MRRVALPCLLALSACASSPPPAHVAAAPVAAADAGVELVQDSGAAAEPEAPPHRPLPKVEITNLCHDVAILAYGEPPNMKDESLGHFLGDSSGTAERERDGSLPVTLVDGKGTTLAKVVVSRRMKKLEIGRSCRTLYAH